MNLDGLLIKSQSKREWVGKGVERRVVRKSGFLVGR